MSKYADDTYLIIPADNLQSCQEEVANVESWANHSNLKLNHAKSAEITCTISGFVRVELIKVLGVTISRRFSVAKHVDELLTSCAQSLFALRTLRQHGLPTEALQAVFQAIIVNKLSYASPAWFVNHLLNYYLLTYLLTVEHTQPSSATLNTPRRHLKN